MSTAQILDKREANSCREGIVIGETYPWCRDRLEPTMRDTHSGDVVPKPGSIDGFASLEAAVYVEGRL